MKYSAILFFVLLVERSFAKRSCKMCCSNITLNITVPLAIYQQVIDSIMVPTIEVGDQWAANFKNATSKAIVDYGLHLTNNLRNEAKDAGAKLIDDIEDNNHRLQRLIRLIETYDAKPHCLEKALIELTDQLWTFLRLKPGVTTTECPVLPEPPPQPVEFKSRTTKRTAEEVFLNLDFTTFSIIREVYGYFAHIYLTSWKGAMSVYEILRIQFYEEILNCSVMCAYRQVVAEVWDKGDSIRYHVSRGVWRYFKDAHNRIVKISDDYCDSLKHRRDRAKTVPSWNAFKN